MKGVILAAGIGSRLGRPYPKSLSTLPNGETIIQRQVRILRQCGVSEIVVVGGFKIHLLMEYLPDVYFRYNPFYSITNTAKSLLCGIEYMQDDVIWLNGDVVFDEGVIESLIGAGENAIAVNTSECGEEEVKYCCDSDGNVVAISKELQNAAGEAVGINKIGRKWIDGLKEALRQCGDHDYFEKGLEYLIQRGVRFGAHDISKFWCVEVDFEEDWEKVRNDFLYPADGHDPRVSIA